MTKPDLHPDSPYGVHCTRCGPQGLSSEEYNRQMNKPDNLWVCPLCGDDAWWDDDRYERASDVKFREDPT